MGAAVAAALAASAANAVIAPFGGVSTGTDPLGQTWSVNSTTPSWGEPGLGLGQLTFNASDISNSKGDFANGFDFIFLKGDTGGILDNSAFTRLVDVTKGVSWTADVVSNQEVDFSAPSGSRLDAGDQFFVNIYFTGPLDTKQFSFAGLWTDLAGGGSVPGVPEPSTWAMVLLGLGLLGAAMRRRRGRELGAGLA